jgi:hypothetical protein
MNYLKICSGVALLSIGLFGCNHNILNIPPTNFVSDDQVWSTTATADLFLNDIYNQLPDQNNEDEHLDQYTDNSDVGVLWMYGYANIATAQLTPVNGTPGAADEWYYAENALSGQGEAGNFDKIRRCNLFIEKVGASTLPATYKTLRIGEARFLRALYYHWLWMAYGGVPIITTVLDNNTQGDSINRPRATADQTFAFIDSELDTVSQTLPATVASSDLGRATSGAALALKGWCELFEASALRNPTNDPTRWAKASATNKQLMSTNTYSLFSNFSTLFLVGNNNSSESIFARQYGPNKGGSLEGKCGPTMDSTGTVEHSWGNYQPTQELVDEFAMASGKLITDAGSGYDPQHPYANREPRFYETIVYDGATWQGFTYKSRVGGNNQIDLGYSSDRTHTGYHGRKRLDETIPWASGLNGIAYQNYMYFRYAEVLLNFAEAENEVNGPTADVLAAVDQIRSRGGIPTVEATYGTVDQIQMRALIRHERRVELCFEDKRWWDVLRWKIADQMPDGTPGVLNRPEMGMVITTQPDGSLLYTPTKIRNRIFLPKMYLMPIPQNVLDQNPVMNKQNGGPDGWVNGQNPGY